LEKGQMGVSNAALGIAAGRTDHSPPVRQVSCHLSQMGGHIDQRLSIPVGTASHHLIELSTIKGNFLVDPVS
jgi:hypothetical protein